VGQVQTEKRNEKHRRSGRNPRAGELQHHQ
jgi:hypothetical protein